MTSTNHVLQFSTITSCATLHATWEADLHHNIMYSDHNSIDDTIFLLSRCSRQYDEVC